MLLSWYIIMLTRIFFFKLTRDVTIGYVWRICMRIEDIYIFWLFIWNLERMVNFGRQACAACRLSVNKGELSFVKWEYKYASGVLRKWKVMRRCSFLNTDSGCVCVRTNAKIVVKNISYALKIYYSTEWEYMNIRNIIKTKINLYVW